MTLPSTRAASGTEDLRWSTTEAGIPTVDGVPLAAAYTDRVVFLADGRVVDELRDPDREGVLAIMSTMAAVAEAGA